MSFPEMGPGPWGGCRHEDSVTLLMDSEDTQPGVGHIPVYHTLLLPFYY
jgi:hypothetical protein